MNITDELQKLSEDAAAEIKQQKNYMESQNEAWLREFWLPRFLDRCKAYAEHTGQHTMPCEILSPMEVVVLGSVGLQYSPYAAPTQCFNAYQQQQYAGSSASYLTNLLTPFLTPAIPARVSWSAPAEPPPKRGVVAKIKAAIEESKRAR